MKKKKITAFILSMAVLVNIAGINPSAGMKSESYSEKQIYAFFKGVGMTDAGASGMMGNMYAESGLKSHNLQNSYEISLGMTDMEYTKKVDAGVYKKFKKDAAGYGLCQWTYHTRKAKLLKYAKSKRKSISDTKMQLQFLIKELKRDYSEVWNTLTSSKSLKTCSDAVLLKFEKPAAGAAASPLRLSYSKKYFTKYADPNLKPEPEDEPTDPSETVVEVTTTPAPTPTVQPAETTPEPTPAETTPEPTPAETTPEPTPAETTPEPTPADQQTDSTEPAQT